MSQSEHEQQLAFAIEVHMKVVKEALLNMKGVISITSNIVARRGVAAGVIRPHLPY